VLVWKTKNTTAFVDLSPRFRPTVYNRDKKRKFAGMDAEQLIKQWNVSLSADRKTELKKQLAAYLNNLLLHNFAQLIQLLYRVDVSEKKLTAMLAENKTIDAGELLADLLIKRQEEKLAARQSFPPADNISDDERW
jgi:hypothetical protein